MPVPNTALYSTIRDLYNFFASFRFTTELICKYAVSDNETCSIVLNLLPFRDKWFYHYKYSTTDHTNSALMYVKERTFTVRLSRFLALHQKYQHHKNLPVLGRDTPHELVDCLKTNFTSITICAVQLSTIGILHFSDNACNWGYLYLLIIFHKYCQSCKHWCQYSMQQEVSGYFNNVQKKLGFRYFLIKEQRQFL